jgi:hypothetical protein
MYARESSCIHMSGGPVNHLAAAGDTGRAYFPIPAFTRASPSLISPTRADLDVTSSRARRCTQRSRTSARARRTGALCWRDSARHRQACPAVSAAGVSCRSVAPPGYCRDHSGITIHWKIHDCFRSLPGPNNSSLHGSHKIHDPTQGDPVWLLVNRPRP